MNRRPFPHPRRAVARGSGDLVLLFAIISELPSPDASRNNNLAMVTGLIITGCVGFLALGATFAVIVYIDARAERRRQQ
ncbi:protein of unknown function [Bradyrhizobium vignae]|uniref:Uncharacterized protein n=1 Tax=Bradyrhizobium vignae TaxID=1549949 RepID=A0A2U3PVR1_9BRAD|nr:protein of unknown function [Bradyrhizobium vignae]